VSQARTVPPGKRHAAALTISDNLRQARDTAATSPSYPVTTPTRRSNRRTFIVKTIAIKALAAASLSLLAVAPAAAQEVQATVHFGDLDLASAAGAEVLNARLLGSIKTVCARPDIRDLKAVAAWEECKDVAMSNALEQLAVKGASVG
jgi:UrcA family protein